MYLDLKVIFRGSSSGVTGSYWRKGFFIGSALVYGMSKPKEWLVNGFVYSPENIKLLMSRATYTSFIPRNPMEFVSPGI